MNREPPQWAIKQHLEKFPKCEWLCTHVNLINLGEEKMNEPTNNFDKPSQEKLEAAAKPLIKYLSENYHPHVTCIVDATHAEVLEGLMIVNTKEYLRD